MTPDLTPRVSFSRRDALKAGVAVAAVPLINALPAESPASLFPTGSADVDRALNGGMRHGTLLVVIGPRGSGKTDFLYRLAKTNGILDAHVVNQGTSDMLSIMQRHDGQFIGSIVLNGHEPSTDKECADMECDPHARDAFLTRWFRRTKEVLSESGGIFALTVSGQIAANAPNAGWMSLPDYIIQAEGSTYKVIKAG
jgi:hypothetical protein